SGPPDKDGSERDQPSGGERPPGSPGPTPGAGHDDAPQWRPSAELSPPPREPEPAGAPAPAPRLVAAVPSRLPGDALVLPRRRKRTPAGEAPPPAGRAHGGALAMIDARPAAAGEPLAILPTLLASLRGTPTPHTAITGGGRGTLLCLIVDTSGSMAARQRL